MRSSHSSGDIAFTTSAIHQSKKFSPDRDFVIDSSFTLVNPCFEPVGNKTLAHRCVFQTVCTCKIIKILQYTGKMRVDSACGPFHIHKLKDIWSQHAFVISAAHKTSLLSDCRMHLEQAELQAHIAVAIPRLWTDSS